MARDLFNDLKITVVAAPAVALTGDTAVVGATIDHAGFASTVYQWTLVTPDADATFTPLLEESNDSGMSGATAVADADLIGTEAGATDSAGNTTTKSWKLGYKGIKRYTRLTLTPASNTGNLYRSAICIQGHPTSAPQSSQSV